MRSAPRLTLWRAPRPSACDRCSMRGERVAEADRAAVYALLVRLDRPAHIDEVVQLLALPRWRVLLALRSQPERVAELMGARWRAKKFRDIS
jgi:hypothetical protein